MNLKTAINHPAINVFDILPDTEAENGFKVYTFIKPNETLKNFRKRHNKNLLKANQLKKHEQDN